MSEKIRKNYCCKKCDYSTSDKKDWNKHISTRKHKMVTNDNKKSEDESHNKIKISIENLTYMNEAKTQKNKKSQKSQKSQNTDKPYQCILCNKSYKHKSGLSRHKKIHENEPKPFSQQQQQTTSVVELQQQQINELQNMLKTTLEQNKNTIDNLIPKLGNTTYNTTNKMTINVFLNEQCKDAMNLTDFVNGLQISLDDLMYTKNHGYAKGISNIFLKHLGYLKPTERPIHCSDRKRLQFYVKDEDKWGKDNTEKIDKSINQVSKKQLQQIKEWEKTHPSWATNDAETEQYLQMIQEVMGGNNEEEINKNREFVKKELGTILDVKNAIDAIDTV